MTRRKVTFANIVYRSQKMDRIVRTAQQVAPTDARVLLIGETGTGKELLANAIHSSSERSEGKFVVVNCSALPGDLLEMELFGHEKGAFTGAVYSRRGKLEQAAGGTILLDEIGEMALPVQAKLLRVLEEGVIERLGSGDSIPLDVRIIAASSQPLVRRTQDGEFLQELYYRLKEVHLNLPPLRERKEDIPVLADYFFGLYNQQYRKHIKGLSDAALQFLLRHDWPGNVRELHHVIKCAVLMNDGSDLVWLEHIPLDIHLAETARNTQQVETKANEVLDILTLDEAEKRHILRILEFTRFNKSQAANILKISRPTLDRKIEKYKLHEIRIRDKSPREL
jgi:transcriptional regulator with PAS, ATPase and Fis domain